jgi:Mg-chelatase subunit ChlI
MGEVDLDPEGTVSVTEAAELLGMTGSEAYELVFRRQLRTVAAPSGRRVVPVEEVERWQRMAASASTPG